MNFQKKGDVTMHIDYLSSDMLCNRVLVILCTLIVVRVSINLLDYLNGVFPAGEPN